MVNKTFEKAVTNVGGSNGVIIPGWMCKAYNIRRGQTVRVTVETEVDGLFGFWAHDVAGGGVTV